MILTYKYRLYPNKSQESLLFEMLDDMRFIYNCALEHRKRAWEKGKSVSYFSQQSELKFARNDSTNLSRWSYESCKLVLRKLNKSYSNFFSLVKNKKKTSTPRFKSKNSFSTIEFTYGNGFRIQKGNYAYVHGIGDIKFKKTRDIDGDIKNSYIIHKNGKWYVMFVSDVPVKHLSSTNKEVGIDVGLTNYVSGSDGLQIKTPQFFKDIEKELRVGNRSLERKKLYSNNWKKQKRELSKTYSKMSNRRNDFLHKLSKTLIKTYDVIVLEKLNLKGLSSGMLSKSFHNASLGIFTKMLVYKAESAGRKIEFVDPKYTSQTCPSCGEIKKKELHERIHSCECGFSGDRDIVAGINILNKYKGAKTSQLPHKVEHKFMLESNIESLLSKV